MKFYLDECVPFAVKDGLKAKGHEVLHVMDWTALRGLSDEQHAQLAQSGGMVLVTGDKGFCKMKS
jgi:predicted nuclease of predicted toxin-antitoxin system